MKVKEKSEKSVLKVNSQKVKIIASCPITSWQIDGNNGNSDRLCFWCGAGPGGGGAPKSLQMVTAAMKLKDTCSLGEKL